MAGTEAIDSLGRSIPLLGQSIDALKDLINSLASGKTGPATPFGAGSGTSKSPIDELTNLFKEYTKDFQSEVEEQKKIIKRCCRST